MSCVHMDFYIFASVYGKIKKYISYYIPIVNVPSCFKFCH